MRRLRPLLSTVAVGLLSGPWAALADDDEAKDRLRKGGESYRNNCRICHSDELTTGSRLTQAQWQAEVTKMIGWGAPVPAEEVDGLLTYLSTSFGSETPPTTPARIAPAEVAAVFRPRPAGPETGDPPRGRTLFRQHCATCHGETAHGGDLGQNLVLTPMLQRPDDFAALMREGRGRMPSLRLVLDDKAAEDLLAWLRRLDDRSPVPAQP